MACTSASRTHRTAPLFMKRISNLPGPMPRRESYSLPATLPCANVISRLDLHRGFLRRCNRVPAEIARLCSKLKVIGLGRVATVVRREWTPRLRLAQTTKSAFLGFESGDHAPWGALFMLICRFRDFLTTPVLTTPKRVSPGDEQLRRQRVGPLARRTRIGYTRGSDMGSHEIRVVPK